MYTYTSMYKLVKQSALIDIIFPQTKAFPLRYPAPVNIGYLWNFGSPAGIFPVVQISTGSFPTMFHTPHTEAAFLSVDHIMRNINNGWLIRHIHANGASFPPFLPYIHMLRGSYFNSYQYPRTGVWFTGVTIYLLPMGTAFLGYVSPRGQMSFWAATVTTNSITVVPIVGDDSVYWVWGGFSINNATSTRFSCIHHLPPFIISPPSRIHPIMPHQASSTNESRLRSDKDTRVSFHPHPVTKDLLTLTYAFASPGFIVFHHPELFNHSVNYIAANILVTPSHIVPERYLSPYHATLRPISNKVIGISAMLLPIIISYLFPILDCGSGIPKTLDIHHRRFLRLFTCNSVSPGFLGSETAEFPRVEFGTFSTIMYLVLVSIVPPPSMYTHNPFGRVHTTN